MRSCNGMGLCDGVLWMGGTWSLGVARACEVGIFLFYSFFSPFLFFNSPRSGMRLNWEGSHLWFDDKGFKRVSKRYAVG